MASLGVLVALLVLAFVALLVILWVLYFRCCNNDSTNTKDEYILLDHESNHLESNSVASFSRSPSVAIHENSEEAVIKMDWNEMSLTGKTKNDNIIGLGSYGVVLKAFWTAQQKTTMSPLFSSQIPSSCEVAIKVIQHDLAKNKRVNTLEEDIAEAIAETKILRCTQNRLVNKDCIVQTYGIVVGKMPTNLCSVLKVPDRMEAVGIVMRYEKGGSLRHWIHNRKKEKHTIMEKIRVLCEIANGLNNLHEANIVHADIKPDNILLSSDVPPKIRLADFGLSDLRSGEQRLHHSSLEMTSNMRGSPLYSAPEILYNPLAPSNASIVEDDGNNKKGSGKKGNDNKDNSFGKKRSVAKPSRKTDMYAFALVAWELLTEKYPFEKVENEIVLSTILHQGKRPSLEAIPKDCPPKVIDMINRCWQTDRNQRYSALECFTILHNEYYTYVSNVVMPPVTE